MAYIGDLPDYNHENNEYEDFNGIKIPKKIQLAPTASSKQNKSTKSKSSHYDLLDDGYQFGDFTRIFLGEAKQGANNLKNTVINAPKNIVNTGKNIINESEYMKDGWNPAKLDLTRTVLKTGGNLATKMTKGAAKSLEKFYDFSLNASSNINSRLEESLGIISKDEAEKERKSAQDIIKRNLVNDGLEKIGWNDETLSQWEKGSIIKNNNIGGQVVEGIGEMIPTLIAGNSLGTATNSLNKVQKLITTIPTTLTMGVGSYGGALEEAYNEGASVSQANKYALGSTLTEVATEWLTGGVPGVNDKGLLDNLENKTLDKVSNSLSKFIIRNGYNMVGEGAEEALSEIIKPYLKNATYSQGEKINWNDVIQSAIVGGITGGILDLPSNVNELKSDISSKRNNFNLNTKQNNNTSTNLSKINQSNINNLETQNSSQNSLNQLNNSIQNNSNNSYQYEQSNNQKINILKESASKYFDNSETTKNLLDTYSKIIQDKNYNVIFDDAIINNNNQYVNAQIKTLPNGETEIRINPNSDRAGEFLIMHEVTHAIETNSMKELVLDYASKNSEFNQALESLKQTYGTEDVSSEVLADISGQLFGNQEFINNLSMEKPNIFKRIYNSIVSLANKITGNSKESLFIKDLKNKWETAYRNATVEQAISNLNGKTKYAQKTLKDGTHYIETEKNLFTKEDGTAMNQREIYNSLIGKQLTFNDGITATIKQWLPNNKNMYNELFKRYPNFKNVNDIKSVNKNINENIVELLENSDNVSPNEPDYMNRHKDNKISSFDTRKVSFYDGKNAYDLDFSIAKMQDGNYVAYAKRNLSANNELLNKIKKEAPTSKSRGVLPYADNISQNNNNVNNDTSSTKYSMQEDIKNTQVLENGSFSLEEKLEKYVYPQHVYERYKNEDKSKIVETIEELKKYKETLDTETDEGWTKNFETNQKIKALENGFDNVYENLVESEKNRLRKEVKEESGLGYRLLQEGIKQEEKNNQLQNDIANSSPFKNAQFQIIQQTNPAPEKTNYVWIRSPKDIKTFNEVIVDDGESFNWGDFTIEDAKKALHRGNVTVYSSYPIKNGVFVSTSYQQALDYAGGEPSKVHSRKVALDSVAWINGDEGQYAKVNTKYSQENETWQEHLEKNYKSTGTRTEMNKIKKGSIAPKLTSQETRKLATEIKKETPIKEINQKKIENNENAIKRLEQEKDALTKRIEDKIKQKQQLLNSKQNKDTKLSTQLNIQISNLNNQLQNRKLDYDRRIKYYKNKNEKMNSKEFKIQEQRMTKKQEYIDQAYELTENMVDWKDKSAGIKYQINTMKRNMYDIMSKADADKMYSTYFQPISENNSKSEKFINSYNERIKKLNLNNKESVAVQMLGEYKYNKETLVTGPQVDQYISDNKLDYDKLSNAVEEFRTIYDELIVETNKILKEQGYKEIEYRKGYFPHFQEEKPQSKFAKLAEKMGFKIDKNQLPTDIAGMTEIFKPGRTYFKNAQQRLGKTTDYNALKGFDNYIRGAADLIFHTEDIQKLRALETVIRTQYTDDAIRQKIESISNNNEYDQEQKQALIDLEFAKINNPLPNLVTEIRNYTDSLANKKDIGDRGMEHMLGRETYTIMKNVQSRVSANMVGFNISSALTNFIPITQAWSQVSTKNMAKAIKESISNQFRNDGFDNCSSFLINRTKQADRLYKTKLDNINSKASVIFEAIDSITSNTIVRGKYYDNIDKGMSQEQAIKNANEFAKDIMAGRDKGSMPTIFNRKSPLVKLVTAFQLEVNNQYGYMLKDLPRDLGDETKKKLVGAFVKMFLGAWLYNQFSEAITGRKSAFSPIDIVGDSVKTAMNDNLSSYDKISNITTDIVGELPFVGGLLGGGRLPIQSAIPDIGITTESITQLSKDDTRNKAIKNLTKELSKPLFYVVMPFGGGQLKKTIEGASMYTHDVAGSYTSSGKLRFEAPKNPIGVTKSLIFGQYSSKNATEYFDKGYAPLTEKQIKEWKSLDISLSEYRKYRADFTDLSSIKSDKDSDNKTIKGSASGKKAYSIMNNDALSKKEKNYLLSALSSSVDDYITVDKLNKIANDQEIYKFFYSLNTDNRKKFINDIENNGFDSYQLYEYYQTKNQYEKSYTNLKTKELIIDYLVTSNLNDSQKYYLYSKDYVSNDTINLLNSFNVKADNYLNTMKYVNDVKNSYIGDSYKNYRRNEIYKYINGLNASILEKVILYKQAGYSISNYKSSLYDYIEKMPLTAIEKKKIWNQLF